MSLPEFSYLRPNSLQEALELAARHRDDMKFLAGGQTLVPLLSMRLARPGVIMDLSGLQELRHIELNGGRLRIGALTRHREVAESPLVQEICPLLAAAASHIGHAHIRNRGTIGGSLAHADPAAEYPVAVTALSAKIEVSSADGVRSVPAEEFFLGPLTSAVMPGELVTAVEFPLPEGRTGWSFREMVLRSGDFALVSVAALVGLAAPGGAVNRAVVAIGGAGPVPVRARRAEELLLGQTVTPALLQAAGEAAMGEIDPEDDIHAPAEYRRLLTRVYVRDTLAEAFSRVGA